MHDEDLNSLGREELIAEVRRLREGIRKHRDATGHALCWYWPALWNLLPERAGPQIRVPEWPQFLRGCVRFRESLDEAAASAERTHEEYE